MPFDANLELHDGTTITAAIGDITSTSLTRTNGNVCIDLLALSSTPAMGMGAVLIMGADMVSTDTLQVNIQHCATLTGAWATIANFPLLTAGTGLPGTYLTRFVTTLRYIRAHMDQTDNSGSFSVASVYVLLAYHPFHVL